MTRCYEGEHWRKSFGRVEYHCGNGTTINGVRYCLQGGTLGQYFGWCAAKDPPEEKIEQISFFESQTDHEGKS